MRKKLLFICLFATFILSSCNKDDDYGNKNNNNGTSTPSVTCNGTLIFVNNSSNPYSVTVNNEYMYRVEGNSTVRKTGWDKGYYSIKVKQLSGYVLYPTEQEYYGDLTCNGSLKSTFPN